MEAKPKKKRSTASEINLASFAVLKLYEGFVTTYGYGCRTEDIASALNVAHITVRRHIAKLVRNGYLMKTGIVQMKWTVNYRHLKDKPPVLDKYAKQAGKSSLHVLGLQLMEDPNVQKDLTYYIYEAQKSRIAKRLNV